MSVATVQALEKIYRIRFEDGLTPYLEAESPLIRWVPKEARFGGWKWWVTHQISAVRGSTKFSTAMANKNSPSFVRMEITRSQDHAIVSVDCEAAAAAEEDEYALVDALENAVESAAAEMVMSIEALLTGNGGGSRGKIKSGGISGAVITLDDPSRIVLFAKDMRIELAPDDGVSAAAGVRAGVGTIDKVNIEAGTLTLTVNVTTAIPLAAAADFIFREGDYDGQAKRVLQGFFAWCPDTAPTAGDNFFGADRSVHPTALAGTRLDGKGANAWDTVQEALALNRRNKGQADTLWVNPVKFAELNQWVTAKQTFGQEEDPRIGFRGFTAATPQGALKIMETAAMPEQKGLLTRRDAWKLRHLKAFPHVVNDDGQEWHLEALEDALQQRQRYYAQLGCPSGAMKHHTNITFGTP